MNLRRRVSLLLALIAAAVGVLAGFGAYLTTQSQLTRAVDQTLLERAAQLLRPEPITDRRPHPDGDDRCRRPTLGDPTEAQIIDADGDIESCDEELPVDAEDLRIASAGESLQRLRTTELDGRPIRLLTIGKTEGGAIQVARPLAEARDILTKMIGRLALVVAAATALAAIAGNLIARRLVRPLRTLQTAAEHIAATGDLDAPLPDPGRQGPSDEIASLTASFRSMVGSLSASKAQQRRLVSDASHELRTPLTSVQTNLDLLARAPDLDPAERAEVIADIRSEVRELTALVAELVELAHDENGLDESTATLSLRELVEPLVTRAIRRSGRQIELDADDSTAEVRPTMAARAVGNLIDNAAKYSPPGSPIEVTIRSGRVEVRDHGPGIAEADLPHVFERFYRATEARTRPGSGLGLAIVAHVAATHGGTAAAHNHPDGGAVVSVTFPT
jgi:two-component system sensor histidine kinase MprB